MTVRPQPGPDSRLGPSVPVTSRFRSASISRSRRNRFVRRVGSTMLKMARAVGAFLALPFTLIAALFVTDGHFSPVAPVVHLLRLVGLARRPERKVVKTSSPSRSTHTTRIARENAPPRADLIGLAPPSASGSQSTGRRMSGLREDLLSTRFLRRKASAEPASGSSVPDIDHNPLVAAIKSPSSPSYSASASRKTRYPTAPSLPRPLAPRRQPSFSRLPTSQFGPHTKTLILDLDETLIHSRPKGNSMLSNHVIEVYSSQPDLAGNAVPVLFSVNKRPYCDEFLRKASKWYKLYAFTASTQAYADQLIDWLENEGKYFSGRFYRQHCKMTDHGFVKDIAQIEPDLSKVMIVDNTPLSYSSYEDNGIPISGWIDDQSDKSLLQLIPLLEGLQHVPDVRAFLGLRTAGLDAM